MKIIANIPAAAGQRLSSGINVCVWGGGGSGCFCYNMSKCYKASKLDIYNVTITFPEDKISPLSAIIHHYRQRRWPNIKPTLFHCVVFAGYWPAPVAPAFDAESPPLPVTDLGSVFYPPSATKYSISVKAIDNSINVSAFSYASVSSISVISVVLSGYRCVPLLVHSGHLYCHAEKSHVYCLIVCDYYVFSLLLKPFQVPRA